MILSCDHITSLAPARSFASLMELYENNYIYMRRLVPDVVAVGDEQVSRGEVDLYLRIEELSPYTSTVALTHYFDDNSGRRAHPDLLVRIYHDAQLAEVLPDSALHSFRWTGKGAPPDRRSLAWRWEVNRFLNRWLRYCLGEGHRFPEPGENDLAV
ncbi:hypothetical protein CAI21_12885 [Alkalilimnicola ehrlichii]|uniref:DUF1249 domain-containing protein n=1 Tax=Alkalilimnicola ehrlichii TaxID=351052 RepID=A0A3E0WQY5_9GAMM|nr:DUF1249 domain-containing protein [Alkalilimnicola ehrlichii]RFA28219.1 hypothetical protein CAI21_12885 [Alkalilimnicola ehrlichii]RFA34819.1 hypothetical protein CAL65_14020 [Alkalilimnicola ehrlichii]